MFDFVHQLRETLADRDLPKLSSATVDAAAREAAYRVAVAWGQCRAAQQSLPSDVDATLNLPTAVAAAEHARWLVGRLRSFFSQLTGQASEVADMFADEDARCSIVLTRHELWAATNAIHEALNALGVEGESAPVLADQLSLLIEETAGADTELITHADELAAAVDFPLLGNLRSSVKEPGPFNPWWLDGVIESAAERSRSTFLNALPDPQLIEKGMHATASKAAGVPGHHGRGLTAIVARLLSDLTVSRTASAEASDGTVSVQVTATPESSGRSLMVSIACNTSGGQRVDWEGIPVRLESLSHAESRCYCTLNEDGRASIGSLRLGTYRVRSWATAVRINDPIMQGGQPPELSRDRRIRARVLEDLKTVEVIVAEPLSPDARLMGVLVNADGTEALPEQEIDVTDNNGQQRGIMSLGAQVEHGVQTLAAAADAQFEWLLVFVDDA